MEGTFLVTKDAVIISEEFFDLFQGERFSFGSAYIDLLLTATREPGEIRTRGRHRETVPAGTVYINYDRLSQRWRWSRGKIERFVHLLEDGGLAKKSSGWWGTCCTLTDFEKYLPENV